MSFEVIFLSDMSRANIWSRPIAPYRLANQLRSQGFSTLVINGVSDYSEEELIHTLEKKIGDETLFIGLSSTFMSSVTGKGFIPGLRTNRIIDLGKVLIGLREKFPKVKFAVGGANSPHFLETQSHVIDYFVFGYADLAILELAHHLKHGTSLLTKSEGRTQVIITDNESNSAGITRFHTHYEDHDTIFENETLVLEISRGCRFKCNFCSYPMNGRKKNSFYKSDETLKAELIRNYEMFNVTNYILADDTYNESIEKLEYFKKVFTSLPFKINFATYLRLDLIHQNPESIKLLLDSGLGGAFFGIESLYEPAARSIGKGLASELQIKTLHELKNDWGDQVHTTANFIVGLPLDTPTTVRSWLAMITDTAFPIDHASVNPLYIGKTTPYFPWASDFQLNADKNGYTLKEDQSDTGRGVYWESEHFNSVTAKQLVDEYYAAYFKVRRPYDSFNLQALKGYKITKKIKIPEINNPEHQKIIDLEVAERAEHYKQRISSL